MMSTVSDLASRLDQGIVAAGFQICKDCEFIAFYGDLLDDALAVICRWAVG